MKHDYVIMVGLIAMGVLASFLFTFYGMNMVMSGSASDSALVFAYVTIAYGLGSLAVLSLAWSSREAWAVTASKLFGFCFVGVCIMDFVRGGMQDRLGVAGLIIVAVVVCANWLAVKKVIERD
jgi:hypothetical protein